jgi:hypothetical protein
MTEQTNDTQTTEEVIPPIIPPQFLLIGAGIAFLVALGVLLGTPGFGAIGWGALVVGVLMLVLLIVLAPQQTVNFLTGRSFRFGSTSILVTVFFIALLMTIYWFINTQDWTFDVTQTDQFSLNEQAAETIATLSADPTLPDLEILGFYTAAQIGLQEQVEILLRDYERVSDGKITYRFINPDRDIAIADQYGATPGQLVIVNTAVDDPEAAEVLNSAQVQDQNQITNAIIEAVASGEFNVYFVEVDNGVALNAQTETGAALFVEQLSRYNWNFQPVTFTELTAVESEIELNDPNSDGEVLVFAGGSSQLNDTEVELITSYLDAGGSVVIAAAPDGEEPALASTEALNTYLAENFGISFEGGIILDPANARGGQINLIDVQDISQDLLVTQYIPPNASVLLNSARPITVIDDMPFEISTYALAETTDTAYTKQIDELLEQDVQQDDDDPAGPFTVLAAAENQNTGARVVLAGSDTLYMNAFLLGQGLGNFETGFGTLAWTLYYNEFEQGQQLFLPDLDIRPEDVPVSATQQQLGTINLISLFVMPFGVLIIGGVVWFLRRD